MAEDTIMYNTILKILTVFIFTVTDCHLKNGAYEALATANACHYVLHIQRPSYGLGYLLSEVVVIGTLSNTPIEIYG